MDGVIVAGMSNVIYGSEKYTCVALKTIQDNPRAFVFLENLDEEVTLRAPAAAVSVGDFRVTTCPPCPQSDVGIINYAFAILKDNLRLIEKRNVSKFYKCFDLLEWRPSLDEVFGFAKNKTKTRSVLSLVDGSTESLDKYLGKRWDVLAGGSYLVTKILFYKKKISHTLISPSKIQCQLYMMQGTHDAADYRQKAMPFMLAQFLHSNNSSAALYLNSTENPQDNNQPPTTHNNHIRPAAIGPSTMAGQSQSTLDWVCHVCDGVWGSDTDPNPTEDMVRCVTCIRQCKKQNMPLNGIPCAHFPSCSEKDKKCALHSQFCVE